ncbi:MAG: proton-conducting membrane transporter [Proteobacteria bacterium]|nr:proton-conducting membrane transporter [Pseudomonadota bacterium]
MVTELLSPLNIIIIALGAGFLLPLIHARSPRFAGQVMFASLLYFVIISAYHFYTLIGGAPAVEIITAGIQPPFAINLRFGLAEAFVLLAVNTAALFGARYMFDELREHASAMILFIVWIMGINGMVMTRDLFNLFIFVEITAVSSFVLVAMRANSIALSAGFKYVIAGTMASGFLLLGTMLLYYQTGTLNIDDLIIHQEMITGPFGTAALMLVLGAILVELKPFPANGWGLDVYQAAPAGIAALLSVGVSAAYLFALYKILPLLTSFLPVIAATGLLTFVASNFIGLRQSDPRRLLGYSSVGQLGLMVTALALLTKFSLTEYIPLVVGGLFISHFLAKAGLFWLAGIIKGSELGDWSQLRSKPVLIIAFLFLITALAGLPPFPTFWAKWQLVMSLMEYQQHGWVFFILLGSLLEVVYLFRWFGKAVSSQSDKALDISSSGNRQWLPVVLFVGLLLACGQVMASSFDLPVMALLPVYAGLLLMLIDGLGERLKQIASLLVIIAYSVYLIPSLDGLNWIFGLMLLPGSILILIASTYQQGTARPGFYPLFVMLVLSLGTLLAAETMLGFFLAWELMTVSSYLLVSLGKKATRPSLVYLVFSIAGAFLILFAFALIYAQTGSMQLSAIGQAGIVSNWPFILLLSGFFIKMGGLGVHVWLPDAYAECDDDFTAMMSSVVSKAGVFGLFVVGTQMTAQLNDMDTILTVVGWVGLIMALAGAIMAAMSEDIKHLLAYSSIGQLGYIVTTFAIANHTGWVAAMYLAVNHLLYKGLIFLAIAGVLYRVKTRYMYQMGGLIKNMPISFISVLIGIITISGVPPLLGFGGKWLLYNALLERGWYLQAGLAFFASAVAFLYLFKLIHTIFLGQRKSEHEHVKEAPLALLIPQITFMVLIMAFSMFPNILIQPLSDAVAPFMASTFTWEGYLLITENGYWNGFLVMNIVGVLFMAPAILLWLVSKKMKVQKVKQFNIVFAAERPFTPATTHYAYNFYAFYDKAIGFLTRPDATRFWNGVSEWGHTVGASLRRFYTGNGQTYAGLILFYIGVMYLAVRTL